MHSIQARLGGESLLHSVAMQDVGGERVEQHGGRDLLDAPDREMTEFAVSPVAMDAFADRPFFVARLAGIAGHAPAPRPHPRAIRGERCVRLGTVLGVPWGALDPYN